MSTVTGKTDGVAKDIIDYLTEIAKFYATEIKIHSGKRTPSESANAVFNNWTNNLNRGQIYVVDTLPPDKRSELDNCYKTAKEDPKAKTSEKKKAEEDFLKTAAETIGMKTLHYKGRAVDILKSNLTNDKMREAIKKAPMSELLEPGCYHYQSPSAIGAVTEDKKKQWQK